MSTSGYVPVFGSLTTGTLCGRWPDIGLWPIVLSLSDKNGHVDVTHEYIAGVTGLPVDDVIACMKRFREPDPRSRSNTQNGARVILLDQHRDWGWSIVNHAAYRERARLLSKDAARTASGQDAERKRLKRDSHQSAKNPTETANGKNCPPLSPGFPLSDADADANKESKSGAAAINSVDPRKTIFDLGVAILGSDGRSLIAKALKNSTEEKIGALLGEMSMSTKADPRAYFIAAISKVTQRRRHPG